MCCVKIRKFFSSIRTRLTLLFTGLLALALFIFSGFLYQIFITSQQNEFDVNLHNHAVDVAQSVGIDFFGDFVFNSSTLRSNEKFFPFTLGRTFMQVVSPQGQIVERSTNLEEKSLPLYTEDWQQVFDKGYAFRTLSASEMDGLRYAEPRAQYRQITYLVRRGKPAFVLQIAAPTTFLYREASALVIFFLIGIPTALILSLFAGFYLSNQALKPVREIIKKADLLNPSNLAERLPTTGTQDEIGNLTETLNNLLGRIQKAFDSQEHFIADASHQLKTPLAVIRGELDVFRSKERTPEEVSAIIDSASQELQHMSRLVNDLLLMAKIDAGAGSLILSDVRLDEVFVEVVARMEVLAKKKNISIRFDLDDRTIGDSADDFLVKGDFDLLQSMFRNLLDNAIKYSPDGSVVEVKLINEADKVITCLRDYGAPISDEVRARIFQRYDRGDFRMSGVSGTGLGLTIAQRIAELHEGKISFLQDNSPGKTFQIEMKKV
jgi:signal transduction histidine kinase